MYAHTHMHTSYIVVTLPDFHQVFRLAKADLKKKSCVKSCVGAEIAVLIKSCLKGWPLAGYLETWISREFPQFPN